MAYKMTPFVSLLLFYGLLLIGVLGPSHVGKAFILGTNTCAEKYIIGTCPPEEYQETNCSSNDMCNGTSHMVCGTEQKCECEPNRTLSRGRCLLNLGSVCHSDDECMEDTGCLREEHSSVKRCTCSPEVFFPTGNGTCEKRKHLKETCTRTEECVGEYYYITSSFHFKKIESFLVCENGQCRCDGAMAEEDTQDPERYCAKRLHQPCKPEECLTGSNCLNGTCQCNPDTSFDTGNNTCEKRRPAGGFCRHDWHCQQTLFCNNITKACTCPQGKVQSLGSSQCVTAAGNVCVGTRSKPCVPNAECQQLSTWQRPPSHVCRCLESFSTKANSDGFCYVKENGTCTNNPVEMKSCLPGLACRSGFCSCLYKEHQVYNQTIDRCLSLVGGPCKGSHDCEDNNAECNTESNVPECRCRKGYIQAERECDLAFGEKCRNGGRRPRCDRFGGLECSREGICECPYFKVYNHEISFCQGMVGAVCKPLQNKVKREDEIDDCMDGTYCRPFRGFEKILGMCTCKSGLITGKDRKCKLIS